MKHIYLFAALFCCALLTQACNDGCIEGNDVFLSEERTNDVSDFSEIELNCDAQVNFTQSDKRQVFIEGDGNIIPYIRTETEGSILYIESSKSRCIDPSRTIIVDVSGPYEPKFTLNSSGSIYCGQFDGQVLRIRNNGSGEINIQKISTNEVDARLNGSGDIRLAGDCHEMYVSNIGSGLIKAYSLLSDDAEATVSGSGDIFLSFYKTLYAQINGSGNIFFKGNSIRVDIHDNGSGSVIDGN